MQSLPEGINRTVSRTKIMPVVETKQPIAAIAAPKKSMLAQQAAWIKPLIVFVMLLVLLIPLAFIRSLVNDREQYQRSAEASIMEPVGGEPALEGLILAVPYDDVLTYTNAAGTVIQKEKKRNYILTVPATYELAAQIDPHQLSRGIFTVPIFTGTIAVTASFSPFQFSQFNIEEKAIRYKDAVLILGIKDKKMLTAYPALSAGGDLLAEALTNHAEASPFRNAVYYTISEAAVRSGFSLEGNIAIQGGKSVSLVPLAADNTFAVRSAWAAPSFSGGWLPQERLIDDAGFSADWRISGLSTVFPRTWKAREFGTVIDTAMGGDTSDSYRDFDMDYNKSSSDAAYANPETVKVSFITPVNHYSRVKRCITYAILFLTVPFLAIFLCELWSAVRIHPIQYFLIGIADLLFYLLLLSFSEHLAFNISYLIATAGVCVVVGLYTGAIFRRMYWGLLLTAVQAISYLLLFGILQSENYALLIGSIGIFCVVALLMFLTRKVDWYGASVSAQPPRDVSSEGQSAGVLLSPRKHSGGSAGQKQPVSDIEPPDTAE